MLIRQHDYYTGVLRLATIKGHSKMCSFTVLGGPPLWPPFSSCSATHLLHIELIRLLIVECWSTPLQWMCEVAGYWQELEHVGLRRSWRWRCWMWRSWAGVVTRGLRLWGRLDVLPNSRKQLWRWLKVEKWTFNSRATALVDISPVSIPIAHSLKTCVICGIVLCDKTSNFRVALYCGQHKAHLFNNQAV